MNGGSLKLHTLTVWWKMYMHCGQESRYKDLVPLCLNYLLYMKSLTLIFFYAHYYLLCDFTYRNYPFTHVQPISITYITITFNLASPN